uniref:Uncharacterized protein n=1 Tax=Branchiostoma floridae TaxID=7739 RepID=C3Z157_BRAFL|eukprot:XP_002597744.1 hypothetical protein BRAFLDRAFT_77353 [Branchiostoma floridae]
MEKDETPSIKGMDKSIRKADFVAARLMSTGRRKTCSIYMAEVIEYEEQEEEARLSFMKKSGDVYIWPENKDTSWEATDNIICTVGFPIPTMANSREQFRLRLSKEDIT